MVRQLPIISENPMSRKLRSRAATRLYFIMCHFVRRYEWPILHYFQGCLNMYDYSDDELSAHRRKLNSQLRTLESLDETARNAAQTVTLDQSMVGRLSRMDALQGQSMAKATAQRRQLELVQLHKALKRIDEGHFGECIECLEFIDPRRLAHNPAVALCLSCASKLESAR